MAKYDKLTQCLSARNKDDWSVSFNEIEAILGFRLPDSARRHKAWWANNWNSQGRSWMNAGYRARHADIDNELVTFTFMATPSKLMSSTTLSFATKVAAELLGVRPSQLDLRVRV